MPATAGGSSGSSSGCGGGSVSCGAVRVSDAVYQACIAHALTTEREEVLGLLLGSVAEGVADTIDIYASLTLRRNDKRPDRCEIPPEQLVEAAEYAENLSNTIGRQTRVLGWYHSHPHITVLPSHVDLATQLDYQQMCPEFVGLIFAVFNKDPRTGVHRHDLFGFRSAEEPNTRHHLRLDLQVEVVPPCRLLAKEEEEKLLACENGGALGQHAVCAAMRELVAEVRDLQAPAPAQPDEALRRDPVVASVLKRCGFGADPAASGTASANNLALWAAEARYTQQLGAICSELLVPLDLLFEDMASNAAILARLALDEAAAGELEIEGLQAPAGVLDVADSEPDPDDDVLSDGTEVDDEEAPLPAPGTPGIGGPLASASAAASVSAALAGPEAGGGDAMGDEPETPVDSQVSSVARELTSNNTREQQEAADRAYAEKLQQQFQDQDEAEVRQVPLPLRFKLGDAVEVYVEDNDGKRWLPAVVDKLLCAPGRIGGHDVVYNLRLEDGRHSSICMDDSRNIREPSNGTGGPAREPRQLPAARGGGDLKRYRGGRDPAAEADPTPSGSVAPLSASASSAASSASARPVPPPNGGGDAAAEGDVAGASGGVSAGYLDLEGIARGQLAAAAAAAAAAAQNKQAGRKDTAAAAEAQYCQFFLGKRDEEPRQCLKSARDSDYCTAHAKVVAKQRSLAESGELQLPKLRGAKAKAAPVHTIASAFLRGAAEAVPMEVDIPAPASSSASSSSSSSPAATASGGAGGGGGRGRGRLASGASTGPGPVASAATGASLAINLEPGGGLPAGPDRKRLKRMSAEKVAEFDAESAAADASADEGGESVNVD